MVRASELELGKFFWAFWCLNSPSLIYSVACKNGNPWKGGLLTRTSMLYKMRDSLRLFLLRWSNTVVKLEPTEDYAFCSSYEQFLNKIFSREANCPPSRWTMFVCLFLKSSENFGLRLFVCSVHRRIWVGNKLITFCRPFLDVYAVWIMSNRFFRSTPCSMLRKFHSERARR